MYVSMDVLVFGPIKRKWACMLQIFKVQNKDEGIMSKAKFCQLLDNCLNENLTETLLRSAFSKALLFPFCADNFGY